VKLWGIDYSEDMINIAKKTVKGVNFMLGDIRELEKNI
jgi:ubiquinone/menaquinone biosynthesis C-methylase UbiE